VFVRTLSEPPHLFRPLAVRGLTLKNRVVISPMCQHAANEANAATDWHLVHLGKFALGGAALIFTESTAVRPEGRVWHRDLGLWSDEQIAPLKRVVDFVHEYDAAFGVQLCHTGRKAGTAPLWEGGAPLTETELVYHGRPWVRVGPSALAAGPTWTAPRPLSVVEIEGIIASFVSAVRRADKAGADVIELHFAHGYLVASFLSPKSNLRHDAYGGDRDARMRLALEIAERVRAAWPSHKPLFCRISAVDGTEGGWDLDDSVVLAARLKSVGVDVIDCSSGGLRDDTQAAAQSRGPGFQVPYAERIRRDAQIMTLAVGLIHDPHQAEAILAAAQADLIALARQALYDPYWAHHAANSLGWDSKFASWPIRHGSWLAKRAPLMAAQERERGLRW
jgi:2,4-dienoyl-CoA reductase-like NADH-dependent reductase (Old Yellow Enzyme family)